MSIVNRRRFIERAALVSIASLSAGSVLACGGKQEATDIASTMMKPRKLDRIGVQLYTLRNEMKESVPTVLESLGGIGYDEVEFAGYFDHSPNEIRKMLDDNGLAAPSAHVPLEAMIDSSDSAVEAASIIGHEYLIVPWMNESLRKDIDGYKRVCAQLNEIGAKCKANGLQLAYHNHEFEFAELGGQVPYDVMLAECDANLVKMQLDLFWITEGGKDPLAYFDQHPGRFPLVHVKDRTEDGTMVSVGQGVIEFAAIFAKSETAGLKHFVVEHDNPEDAVASVTASYEHLSALEF